MDTPSVELASLTMRFRVPGGTVTAVDHVDLTVGSGEVVALLGPNGAGKTTMLDLILGLAEPSAGRVSVFGLSPRQALSSGRISAMLQSGGLLADLTVVETLRYLRSTYARAARIDDVLERAGLTSLARRRVSKCSGGEQQRLRFALALLPDPDLLILDEPTTGMDVSARRDFWAAMQAEALAGRTVVFATHYLEEAEAFARRIVLLAGGRVVADGPTGQVRALAAGRLVSAEVPDLAEARRRLGGLASAVEVVGNRITVRAVESDAVARVLLGELGARELEVRSASLEDAFLALTTRTGPAAAAAGAALRTTGRTA